MLRRKPDSLALLVALFSSLAVLGAFWVDLHLSRQHDLDEGQQQLRHFGVMVAEHTARSLEAVDILLRDVASDLSSTNRDWPKWEPSRGWEYITQHHSRALPQLRDLIVFDEIGNQLFISTYYPAPRINVRDRPYFVALEGGAEFASYGPYIGRNSGRYTYALARRLKNGQGGFAGAAFAALEPNYFQEFCWANRLADDFEAALINDRGQVVFSCRPVDTSRQSRIIAAAADEVFASGRLKGQITDEESSRQANGYLLAVNPVPGYPGLRIVAVLREGMVLASWQKRGWQYGIFATLIVAVLFIGGWLVRRQVRELSTLTAELADSRNLLEARIEEATAALQKEKQEAERASTAKSRFLAAASHDLRQPLHALSLFSADLHRQLRAGRLEELPRLADQIGTSTSVLGELLDSLLDISRLDVAGIPIHPQAFPLQSIFDRLATSFRRGAQGKHLLLRFRPSQAYCQSDPALIERLLANLVSNAIRYTPDGGRILVAARRRDDRLVVEVRDSGIGIAPEHQTAIFGEFYQVGNVAREHNKGLGLGLSIVDRLAKALACPVTLVSEPGHGTTFTVSIPLGEKPEAFEPAPRPPASLIAFIGRSDPLVEACHLASGWGLYTRQVDQLEELGSGEAMLMVVDEAALPEVRRQIAGNFPLVVLATSGQPIPDEAYALPAPVRPAKFRALLEQLQKTFSKSTP